MKLLHFDCFSGISGNMILGALIHLGVQEEWLRAELSKLPLHGYQLVVSDVTKQGIAAKYVDVKIPHEHHHRHLSDIREIIHASPLADDVKQLADAIFTQLAAAEAKVHNCDINHIHFHEVGAMDAIIDIVGTALCIKQLQITHIYASPLHLGSGTVQCAHGIMPVPAPATAELVCGMPVYTSDIRGELVTPTGAAILKTLAPSFDPVPTYTPNHVGYGAGTKDLAIPNVLRITLGEVTDSSMSGELLHVLECNIDNLNPEIYEYVMDALFAAGALDVTLSPLIMKKSRPGTLLRVLSTKDSLSTLQQILFTETSTLGVRIYEVRRPSLKRHHAVVETAYGPIRVKISGSDSAVYSVAPEYEDCKAIAGETNVPLKTIYEAALLAYHKKPEA